MQLTKTLLYSLSNPSSTMTSNKNYKDTLFERANLTPIYAKPIFETLHKLQNKIKANAKFIYSNLGGVAHGPLVLVLTDAQ